MHNPDGQEEPDAQMARARTRASVPRWARGARPQSATTTDSVRSALDIARQRWASAAPGASEDTYADAPEEAYEEAYGAPVTAVPAGPVSPGQEPETDPEPGQEAGPAPRGRRAASPRPPSPQHPMPYSSWKGSSRPLRDTWRTYCDGAARVIEFSPIAAFPYWVAGVPLYLIHCTARLVQDSTTSVTRGAVFVVVVVILIVGIAIALS